MKLSERLEAKLKKSDPKATLDDLSNAELIDLIADDCTPWKRDRNYDVIKALDNDYEDVLHGVTPSERR